MEELPFLSWHLSDAPVWLEPSTVEEMWRFYTQVVPEDSWKGPNRTAMFSAFVINMFLLMCSLLGRQ